ncbi:MAG: hypothetical protein B7Y80_13675 [Hyphomicrobium sp. 32-62-53]|nr:MAG: hypothetical protein B7Z29_12550 [Hyphomicrobium sp. 12-62-95]OYX99091.1 MAG: hypothetical protein B7Y80_13675 [Hyphomicrobium sp. 32-62-53]
MEERAQFLISYTEEHGPVTVRGLFYRATVAGLPGVDKTEGGYKKIQKQVLNLRRRGRLPYAQIADATRYMRRPRTFNGWKDALIETARSYRKSLWHNSPYEVEIWLEKTALAGVVAPVTFEYDVPLMVTSGYSSETFAYGAVERLRGTGKTLVAHTLFDFDRSGQDAAQSLREKVLRFGADLGVRVQVHTLGLTEFQVKELELPTRKPKRNTPADRKWPHEFAAELDAIEPDMLRAIVEAAIEQYLPSHELEKLKEVERLERETVFRFISGDAA